MKRFRYAVYTVLMAALALVPLAPAAGGAKSYTIGVVPTWPPVAMYAQWSPFVKRLAHDTGLHFRLKVYETMSGFERDLVAPSAPDFIFANSLQMVVAHRAQGYLPLVRGGGMVWAEVFVRRDSPTTTVADLAGKRIAFVGAKNL